jgi:hypothetical protein
MPRTMQNSARSLTLRLRPSWAPSRSGERHDDSQTAKLRSRVLRGRGSIRRGSVPTADPAFLVKQLV